MSRDSDGARVRSHRDLDAWRRGVDWVETIYLLTRSWPREELFGLTSQVRRAAVSVPANLAEGAGRRSTGEFRQFIGIARGSLAEAETHLLIARRLGYSPEEALDACLEQAAQIGRMLSALSRALRPADTPRRLHDSQLTPHEHRR